jgi:hypothetical protein
MVAARARLCHVITQRRQDAEPASAFDVGWATRPQVQVNWTRERDCWNWPAPILIE